MIVSTLLKYHDVSSETNNMHVLGIVLAGSHEVRNQLEAWYNNSL